jgi:RND family efflux transporter MFP subunit
VDLQGVVKSDGDVTVVPLFQGEVMKIYKKVGDKVRKGDLIMKLDDKILRNQIEEVRTQYRLAKTAYERQKRLWDQKIGSEMAYLQARTKYLSLSKKLRTLNEQLKKAKITSPISGTLDDLMIKEGETAMPGRPVARIVNLDKVYVDADVSERYLKEMRKGRPAKVIFPEAGLEKEARLDYVGNFIHPNNRTFKIRIDLDNPEGLLKPNLTAKIKVLSHKTDSAVVIPVSLVQEDAKGHSFVYVLEALQPGNEGKMLYVVRKQPVTKALVYDKKVWISEGLKPGDLLALSGSYGLTEGEKVYVKNKDDE